MKTYILLSLSLLFVSCSTLQSHKHVVKDEKDRHITSVLSRYPHVILVGGLNTDLYEQIARYYQAKGNTQSDNTNALSSNYGITIQRDSLTGEVIEASIPSGILFGFDKYELGTDQQLVIDTFMDALTQDSLPKTIYIVGHTDSIGSNAYNQTLSENRANSVKAYLEAKYSTMVSVSSAFGLGETKPIATNDTDAGRQQNRRVEIIIKK